MTLIGDLLLRGIYLNILLFLIASIKANEFPLFRTAENDPQKATGIDIFHGLGNKSALFL